jgi:putative flippase GtrA
MHQLLTRSVRYSLVSVVSIAISQAVLLLTFGLGHLPAHTSNVLACVVATGPSFFLNRNWAWGRSGRPSLRKEIVPFWALAFLGLAFSTWTTDFASSLAERRHVSHLAATTIVAVAALAAYGALWIGKFVVLNAVFFSDQGQRPRPALTQFIPMRRSLADQKPGAWRKRTPASQVMLNCDR